MGIRLDNAKWLGMRDRSVAANNLIEAISVRGRKFFAHKDRVGRFEVANNCRIWFIDAYTQKRIYLHGNHQWRGFSNGGSLRRLCEALRDFIRTGQPMRGHLGPWPADYCGGDLWGYGFDDMQEIRETAERLCIRQAQGPV